MLLTEADIDFWSLFIYNTCQIPAQVRMIISLGLNLVRAQPTKPKMMNSPNFIQESRKLTPIGSSLPLVLVKTKGAPNTMAGHITARRIVETRRTTRILVLQWIFLKVCHYIFCFKEFPRWLQLLHQTRVSVSDLWRLGWKLTNLCPDLTHAVILVRG